VRDTNQLDKVQRCAVRFVNIHTYIKDAMLSQGGLRDAAVNFGTY